MHKLILLTFSLLLIQSCTKVSSQTKGKVLSVSHDNRNVHCLELNLGEEGQNITKTICHHGDEWNNKLPKIGDVVFVDYSKGFSIYGLVIKNIEVIK